MYVAWYNRGSAKFMIEDYDGAINDYSQCIRLDTTYAIAYKYRGIARIKANKNEEGIKDLLIAKEMGCIVNEEEMEGKLSVNRK